MLKNRLKIIIVLSLIVNILFLVSGSYVTYKKGGAKKVFQSVTANANANEIGQYNFTSTRNSIFNIMPNADNSIVFMGDSLTNNFEWQEMFSGNIKNRGVSGDTTDKIISRLDSVITLKPSKIFIMISTNDLLQGKTVESVDNNYNIIIDELIDKLPNTKIYVESVPPINFIIYKNGEIHDNIKVLELNYKIKAMSLNHNLPYVDIYTQLIKDNQLNAAFTYDGVHLNGEGYKIWCNAIKEYI